MRVLHIVNDLIRGGTEGQCARVAAGLARRNNGTEHHVAVFRRQGFFLPMVESVCGDVYEIPVRHLVRWGTFHAVFRLKKHILREKYDLVHTWDAESAVFGGAAALWAGIPLITSRRDLAQIYPGWKLRILEQMDRKAVRVVANARAIARHFINNGLQENKVVCIPNVVDLVEFGRLAQDKNNPLPLSNHSETLKLICVSRMDPEKDHACLLRAFARFSDENQAVLVLVGDGIERKTLEKMTFDLKIEKKVLFLGEKSEIPSILSQMDAGILIPRSNEGLSNSILEYMASGLPVVCTDCGGNTELVKNDENGLVISISDENELFLALKTLKNAEKRQNFGKNSRKTVENEFSMDAVLDQFEKLYRGVMSSSREMCE